MTEQVAYLWQSSSPQLTPFPGAGSCALGLGSTLNWLLTVSTPASAFTSGDCSNLAWDWRLTLVAVLYLPAPSLSLSTN